MENKFLLSELHQSTPRPAFLVLGPPRTGSTWLHEVLQKRMVLPKPTKETRFFDVHYDRGWEWYMRHFRPAAEGELIGEVAPTYFASPEARARIRQNLPDIRLLVVLRHPLERLLSLYRLKRAYGMYPWDLEQALDRDPELLSSAHYGEHLQGWQRDFPAEQLAVHLFDELSDQPQQFMDAIAGFLGLPDFVLAPEELKRVHSAGNLARPRSYPATRGALLIAEWFKARELGHLVAAAKRSAMGKLLLYGGPKLPETSAQLLTHLHDRLLPEIEFAESTFGRKLPAWRTIPR